MTAELVSIGDELLIGQVVNTNASWLGEQLSGLGISVTRVTTLGDRRDDIVRTLSRAVASSDVVVVTGGLGPTHDDITKAAVAELFGVGMERDASILAGVRARFERRGIHMVDANLGQADVPTGFRALENTQGTAPGLWRPADGDGNGHLFVLPGVPYEMKHLVSTYVLPELARAAELPVRVRKTLLTTGIGESNLAELLGDVSPALADGTELAYLPSIHGVRLRLTAGGTTREEAIGRVDRLGALIRSRAGRYVFGEGVETLESVIGALLREKGWTVATAESCTGGLVASRLTDVPGASAYVAGGVVAYDNRVKIGHLGVRQEDLDAHGAVSEPVVRSMASGARARFTTDVAVATSGVLGPGGGTPEKPVGTVWIAADVLGDVRAVRVRLGGTRDRNKAQAATAALNLLRRMLVG